MKDFKIAKALCAGMTGIMLVSSLTACNGTKESETSEEETTAEESTEEESESSAEDSSEASTDDSVAETTFTLPDKFVFDGDFEVEVVGYEYFDTADSYEYDIVNVYYDFTPLNKNLLSDNSIYWTCTQNGEEQEKDPSSDSTFDNVAYEDNIWISQQEGVTLRGMVSFTCKKGCTDVLTVGVGTMSQEYQYFDVDPKWEMPDIRHADFEVAKVTTPAFGPGGMNEGSETNGKYDVKINEITGIFAGSTIDCDGNIVETKVIGVSYTWTNHTGKEASAFMTMNNDCYVFQDGASLVTCGAGKGSEDEGKTQADLPQYQEIADGESITFTAYYTLRSDSPIEVTYVDFMSKECFADAVLTLPQ